MSAKMLRTVWLFAAATLAAAQAVPGYGLLVRREGRTVREEFHGVRELRTRTPIDAVTDFRLASFTKQFTAMSVMLLVHDGKLRYETRVTDIFPDFPAYGPAITVRHLLTHTGGLPDYEALMPEGRWSAAHQIRDEEVLELLRQTERPKFAAGTQWDYSNSGYVVLGLMVAKVSGMPLREFMRTRIFGPLGMRRTLVYVSGVNTVPNRAYGHGLRDGRYVETDQSSTSATQGDGGVYSNLDDLAKWDDALRTRRLLSAAEMAPAVTPGALADGKPVSYGFGWFLDALNGRARMWHSGTTTGFRTAIERFEDGVTVIVVANRSDFDAVAAAERAAATQP